MDGAASKRCLRAWPDCSNRTPSPGDARMIRPLPLLLALLSGPVALADSTPLIEQRPSLRVTGTAIASVAPDKVDLALSVSSDADTLEKAMRANEANMAALRASMKTAGIAAADLQLSSVA